MIITYLPADYRNLVGSFQRIFNFESLYVFSLVMTLISPIACERKHSFVSDVYCSVCHVFCACRWDWLILWSYFSLKKKKRSGITTSVKIVTYNTYIYIYIDEAHIYIFIMYIYITHILYIYIYIPQTK